MPSCGIRAGVFVAPPNDWPRPMLVAPPSILPAAESMVCVRRSQKGERRNATPRRLLQPVSMDVSNCLQITSNLVIVFLSMGSPSTRTGSWFCVSRHRVTDSSSEPHLKAGLPYIASPIADSIRADELAGEAAMSADGAVLLRRSMNAVYRDAAHVIRIGRPQPGSPPSADLADVLTDAGVRVPSVIDEVDTADGYRVTVLAYIESTGILDWHAVGAMVATLHHRVHIEDVPSTWPVADPRALPWWDLDDLLEHLDVSPLNLDPDHDAAAREAMASIIDRYRWWRAEIDSAPGICHGDLQPANVIMSAEGPVLIDWDLLASAPRGWDHGPMIAQTRRWGVPDTIYEAFAAGYGADLRDDPFSVAVAELRDVAATVMAVRAAHRDRAAAGQACHRMLTWAGQHREPWTAR